MLNRKWHFSQYFQSVTNFILTFILRMVTCDIIFYITANVTVEWFFRYNIAVKAKYEFDFLWTISCVLLNVAFLFL